MYGGPVVGLDHRAAVRLRWAPGCYRAAPKPTLRVVGSPIST